MFGGYPEYLLMQWAEQIVYAWWLPGIFAHAVGQNRLHMLGALPSAEQIACARKCRLMHKGQSGKP